MIKKLNKMGTGFVVRFGKKDIEEYKLSEGKVVYISFEKCIHNSEELYTKKEEVVYNSEEGKKDLYTIPDVESLGIGADLGGASVLLDALKKAKNRCPECNYVTPLEGLCSSCIEEKEAKVLLVCPSCSEAKKPEHKVCFDCWNKEKTQEVKE